MSSVATMGSLMSSVAAVKRSYVKDKKENSLTQIMTLSHYQME